MFRRVQRERARAAAAGHSPVQRFAVFSAEHRGRLEVESADIHELLPRPIRRNHGPVICHPHRCVRPHAPINIVQRVWRKRPCGYWTSSMATGGRCGQERVRARVRHGCVLRVSGVKRWCRANVRRSIDVLPNLPRPDDRDHRERAPWACDDGRDGPVNPHLGQNHHAMVNLSFCEPTRVRPVRRRRRVVGVQRRAGRTAGSGVVRKEANVTAESRLTSIDWCSRRGRAPRSFEERRMMLALDRLHINEDGIAAYD